MTRGRSGLTLVELVVVLAILAALSLVAIEATESKILQARFEASQRSLDGLTAAVTSPDGLRQTDGTPIVTGFVADLGRLPQTVPAPGGVNGFLGELLADPGYPLATRRPAEDAEVALLSGWRGPYLQLGVGSTEPSDGWGRQFRTAALAADSTLLDPAGLAILDGESKLVAGVRSPASNGVFDPADTGFEQDLLVDWRSRVTASVQVSLVLAEEPAPDLEVVLRLYQPDPSEADGLVTITPALGSTGAEPLTVRGSTGTAPAPAEWDLPTPTAPPAPATAVHWQDPVPLSLTDAAGVTVGVRALRAYATDPGTGAEWGKSQIVYAVLVPGQNVLAQLTIRRP